LPKRADVVEMEVSFYKNWKNGHGWEVAYIDKDEDTELQEALRSKNSKIMEQCLADAHALLAKYITPYSNAMPQILSLATNLFEKRAIHSLTAYQEYLKGKINSLRSDNGDHIE